MEFSEIVNTVLPVVYVIVGLALVWLAVELAVTFRKTRETVTEMKKQLDPTLAHVEKITAQLEPVAGKVDPLVDRVSLTVDAANLEIMRVDQILEDVSQVTGSLTKTMDAVDTVTNAPLELVTSVTDKVRSKFKVRGASEESVRLGQANAVSTKPSAVSDLVDAVDDAAAAVRAERRERKAERITDSSSPRVSGDMPAAKAASNDAESEE